MSADVIGVVGAGQRADELAQLGRLTTDKANAIALECERLAAQWQGLKRVGGARDDHAAQMMHDYLRPQLVAYQAWLGRVINEVDRLYVDPWGDNDWVSGK